jgi:hypothetical protein
VEAFVQRVFLITWFFHRNPVRDFFYHSSKQLLYLCMTIFSIMARTLPGSILGIVSMAFRHCPYCMIRLFLSYMYCPGPNAFLSTAPCSLLLTFVFLHCTRL